MAGFTAFIGTCIMGPREGLFRKDKRLTFILDEGLELFEDEESDENCYYRRANTEV